jgi:hypothetical protein
MPKYLVTLEWARDIEAITPRAAAEKALRVLHVDPAALVHVHPPGGGDHQAFEVDDDGEVREA